MSEIMPYKAAILNQHLGIGVKYINFNVGIFHEDQLGTFRNSDIGECITGAPRVCLTNRSQQKIRKILDEIIAP